jgi:hypothetical protein
MNIFELKPDHDIEYKRYNIIHEEYEDFEPIMDAFLFDQRSIKSRWQPLELQWTGDDDNNNNNLDSPKTIEGDMSYCFSTCGLIFSQHAVTVLEPYLQNTVEFLPLKLQPNKFLFALKVLKFFNIEDILDMDKSIIKWAHQTQKQKESGKPKLIDSSEPLVPYFRENMLNDILMFKINPRRLFEIYVTDNFVDIINKNKLTGAAFEKVYPPPDPNEIRRAAYEKAMKKRKKK